MLYAHICVDFAGGLNGKASACNTGDLSWIPGSGRCPGKGNGYQSHQYSCLENPTDRGAWQPIVHGITKSRARLNILNTHTHTNTHTQTHTHTHINTHLCILLEHELLMAWEHTFPIPRFCPASRSPHRWCLDDCVA